MKDIPDIKIITGVRRSGKSKLMDAIYAYVSKHYSEEKNNYLFIDEVQMCEGFERVVNSFHEEEKYDIYLTGSNAFLLSSDLATLFGGRVYEISIYPFSFVEFMQYYPSKDIDDSFDEYVKKGGMSGSYLYKNELDAKAYVNGIYKTTIAKDIVTKFKIENEDLLIMVANFLMDNLGSQTSIRNVANKLTSGTYQTNDKTVGAYIMYLCRSFMFYPMKRYDVKGKRYLESDKKYYLADLSFRFSEIGTKSVDYGHLYENIVAIELLRRGYEVYVGKLYDKEIDFVVIKNGTKTYIQVSDDISREDTFEREVTPLLSIKDAYPKILIARTKHEESQYDGIKVIDIARWLADSPI